MSCQCGEATNCKGCLLQYKYLRVLEFETVLLRHYIDLPANLPPQLVRDNMAAPIEEYVTVRSNESYGVKFDVQRNESYGADIYVADNQRYGVGDAPPYIPSSTWRPKRGDASKNSKTVKVVVLFVLLLALLLATVAACVALGVINFKLKSEIASQESQLRQQGQGASFPLDSCAALPPSSPAGYYWVRTSTDSAVHVYCDPTMSCGGVTGGWRRVAELDMTNSSQQCPSAFRQRNESNIRTCRTDPNVLCTSVTFPVNFLSYSGVCGKIIAYQVGSPDSFGNFGVGSTRRSNNDNINADYLDGVSLTHGSPRQHIWSFAAALDEAGTRRTNNCPCTNRDQADEAAKPPAFVGNDYFCDTGSSGPFDFDSDIQTFHSDDPLWDGAGCGPLNDCCNFNNPPWFHKQLPLPTTDNIEMRVCRDQGTDDEDIAIEIIEIYVQ